MNIATIIQARMNSSRFPGKIKQIFETKTLLETCIDAVNRSNFVHKIIIATTTNKEDDWIESFFKNCENIFVFYRVK